MRSPLGRRVRTRRSLVALGAAALIVPMVVSSASASSPDPRWTIAGSRPAWASTAPLAGSPAESTKIAFNVVLPLRDAAGAAALATEVSDPASPRYGQYVTAAQFNATYGPTAGQVATVKSFLSGTGLDVTGVAAGNRWISVTGTAHQVETVFGTSLRNYRYKGRTIREPSTSLTVPGRMAGLIMGVVGVGTENQLRQPAAAKPSPLTMKRPLATPSDTSPSCSTYWNQHQETAPKAYGLTSFPTTNCGYTPAQLRTAYGVQPSVSAGDTGAGVSVAIIDAYGSPTMLADANATATSEGEPTFKAGQYNETLMTPFDDQSECGDNWNTEESLDVEAVHAIAPGATVDYIGAADCDTGLDDAMNSVVQHQTASIVSNSWSGEGEDGIADEVTTEEAIFMQAATEGIGFYFSSGDDGDNVVPGGLAAPEPNYPTSDPMVTGVGGTSLAVTSSKAYDFETSWGVDDDLVDRFGFESALPGNFVYGAGGGVSAVFTQPSYQASAVPSSLAKLHGGAAMRVVPDIAADADPGTGFQFGETVNGAFGLDVIGGTSLACPLIAGVQALVSQGRIIPIGFANPELYSLKTSAFHDVKAPSTTVAMITPDQSNFFTLGKDTSLTATSGYDDTTGLGTPSGLNFLLGERLLSSPTVPGDPHAP
jgi:subtilase family serine protease